MFLQIHVECVSRKEERQHPVYKFPTHVHLVVEHLGFAGFGFGDQRLVQNIKNILAHAFEFGLDLLTVLANDSNVFLRTLRVLFLLDGGDYAPGSTAGPNNVFVGNGKKIAFVNGKFTSQLDGLSWLVLGEG